MVVVKDADGAVLGRGRDQGVRDPGCTMLGRTAMRELTHGGEGGVRDGASDRDVSKSAEVFVKLVVVGAASGREEDLELYDGASSDLPS